MIEQKSFVRQYGRYSGEALEASLTGEFENLYKNGQPRTARLFTSTPATADVQERELVLSDIAGTRKIVTKIAGALYHITLSAGA